MIIVIDDERLFVTLKDTLYFRTGQDAMLFFAIRSEEYNRCPTGSLEEIEEIWFDHDLGADSQFDALTVARFVKLMLDFRLGGVENAKIYVHSQNPVGAESIVNVFGQDIATQVPLPALKLPFNY